MLLINFFCIKIASLNPLLALALVLFIFLSKQSKEARVVLLFGLISFTDDRGVLDKDGNFTLINGFFHSKLVIYSLIVLTLVHITVKWDQSRRSLGSNAFLKIQLAVLLIGISSALLFTDDHYTGFLHDCSYVVFPILSFVFLTISGPHLASNRFIKKLLQLIALEIVFYFLLFIVGFGYSRGGLILVSLDTGKKIFPFYFILMVSAGLSSRGIRRRSLYILLSLMALVVNLSFSSRSSLLLLVLFLFIELFYNRKLKRSLSNILIMLSFTFGLFYFFANIFSFVIWKVTSFDFTDSSQSLSGYIRYMSLLNIYGESSSYQLFFGKGWASYFTDVLYPFGVDLRDKSAFPLSDILSGKFHKPHTLPLFLLLKVGLVGSFLYSWSFLKVYFSKIKQLTGIAKTMLLVLFILAINIYSTKLQLLGGFYLYLITILPCGQQRKIGSTTKI